MDMLLKNSLKQMGRTKIKTFFFLLLMILTVMFLSLGVNLWQTCNANIDKYEKVFTTVGVINQKEDTMEVTESWNAATKEYTYWDKPVYDSILPVSFLDFDGANYIIKPEQRPYYGAYSPGVKIWEPDQEEGWVREWGSILEIVPYEDCIPTEPVKVKITKVLWGTSHEEGADIWFCDHFNDNPGLLKAGKTYVTAIQTWPNEHGNSDSEVYYESVPYNPTVSTQKNKNGEMVANKGESSENWEEVTDHFYETREGQKWESLVEVYDRFIKHTFPVIPTSKTEFLMDFHQGKVSLSNGRDITEEEYEKGKKVCILPQGFAERNNLKIGDNINLQLYFSDYERSASQTYMPGGSLVLNFGLLNAEGEVYPVFEDSNYEIVGFYRDIEQTTEPTGYEIGYNAVIIPSKSVKNSDENNIVAYGPMKGYTTSFQIQNGTTQAYLEKFKDLGINNLEINFYDGGYEKLASGMENLKMVALILVIVSIATTLAILFFFIFLFVSKQNKRTAIERSFGMSKRQCTLSMFYGIILIISVGAIIGSFVGFKTTGFIMSKSIDMGEELYSTAFSNWVNNSDKISKLSTTNMPPNPVTPILLCFLIILVSSMIALIFIKNNLKAEPLILLSKNEE